MIRSKVMPNGLKVVVDEMPAMSSAAVGLFVGVGGRFEDNKTLGMSHFLEHIVFKGTAHRTCQQIKEEIEGIGGNFNAFTAKEYTCFYSKVLGGDYKVAVDVLSDMLLNPLFDSKDIKQEKGVIVEEIKMYRELPNHQVHDLLDAIIWPSHPLGCSLTGTEKGIRSFKHKDFLDFHQRYYVPNNIVLVVAGKVTAKQVFEYSRKIFQRQSRGKETSYKKFRKQQKAPQLVIRQRKTEQTHIAMGMHGYPRYHKHHYTMGLLSIILGGNMSSRLFKELREERGLAYDVRSSVYRYSDTASFEISAGIEHSKIYDCVNVIMKELRKLRENLVDKSELLRAKKYYLGGVSLNQEKTSERMFLLGEDSLCLGRYRQLKEITAAIGAISLEDVRSVARYVFQDKHLNLAVVGAKVNRKKLKQVLSIQK